MTRKPGLVALHAFTLILTACGTKPATQTTTELPPPVDLKAEVTAAHVARLEDFLAERAEAFAASLAPGAVDLGGGSTGTGVLPAEYFTAIYWRDFMNREQFAPLRGKSAADVADLSATVVLTKAETGVVQRRTPFIMLEGDMKVFTPPKPGSPLFDGWFAIYRKIDGVWRVVALD